MERSEVKLVFFSGILYFICQVSRTDLSASLVDLIADLQIQKDAISIAITAGYVSYAFGMLVNSILADKRNPRLMICISMFGSAAAHIGIRLIPVLPVIAILWCANGFVQSMAWPSILKLAESNIALSRRQAAMNLVVVSQHAGALSCYLVVPAALAHGGWRTVMTLTASACLACGFAWAFARFLKASGTHTVEKEQHFERIDRSFLRRTQLPLIMTLACLCGMVRDGITTWAPVYYNEAFSMPRRTAVLLTALLPASKILSYALNPILCRRIPNVRKMLLTTYLLCFGITLILLLSHLSGHVVTVVIMMTLLLLVNGCANIVFIIQLPLALSRTGRTAGISGIADCSCYIGSAISSFLFAALTEHGGWIATIVCWCILSLTMFMLVVFQHRIGPTRQAAEK